MLTPRIKAALIGVLLILVLVNNIAPLWLTAYHPDTAINGAFVALLGAVAASYRGGSGGGPNGGNSNGP